MTDQTIVTELLGSTEPDAGCDAGFELLDEYADLVAAGRDADAAFPQVAAHLRVCDACREDTEGIIAAISGGVGAKAPPR
jgi:anti-sigma factor ChrR (cupin superfamily)